MDPVGGEGHSGDPTERRKLMKKEKHEKTTVTVRLTEEEDQVLRRLCMLKKTSKTGYLARLAKEQAKQERLRYAAEEYLGGRASLSELAKKTRLDVPTIMDEVASIKGEDKRSMKRSKVKKDTKEFSAAVGRALRRAAKVARKTARMHGTPIYIWK